MKQFENEVLFFDMSSKKGQEQMRKTLSEWGAVGFEVVAVIPSDMHSRSVTVFLKREVSNDASEQGKAA